MDIGPNDAGFKQLLAEGRVTERGVKLSAASVVPGNHALPAHAEDEPEKEFMARVVALAKANGWLCYHTHYSRKSEKGFPDLVLVRDRVIFAELKSAEGRLSEEQGEWVAALGRAGARVAVWRPCHWPQVEAVLGSPAGHTPRRSP